MVPPADPSVVSSLASYSATDISRRTDRTSYSIPDDGRAVTIQTNRRRRKDREREREREAENQSTLSQGTNTSLLIEYFEQSKQEGGSGRRPSVRVKVTPSAARRHRVKEAADGSGLEISDIGSPDRSGRRPSHVQRISLAPHLGEDRIILGEGAGHVRSTSGDHSTLSSFTSAANDSVTSRNPLNVTVIREAGSPGSLTSLPRNTNDIEYSNRRRRRTATRSNDIFYEDDNLKVSKGGRSRSVSRESDIIEETTPKSRKLGRRKSRSLSRERNTISQKEKDMIQIGVKEELERLCNPKSRKARSNSRVKAYDDGLRPSHARSRSRSRERDLDDIAIEKAAIKARRKAALIEDNHSVRSGGSTLTNNPHLIDLIQDTIKRVLPEIEAMKASRHQQSRSNSQGPDGAADLSEMGKPMVVLSPDTDQGNGQGVVISGGPKEENIAESDISNNQALGLGWLGPGPMHSPLHSEPDGEGVSLVGAIPGQDRVLMPEGPLQSHTPAEPRASILTAKSGAAGLPYPVTANSSGMPSSGYTPPLVPKNTSPNPNNNRNNAKSELGFPEFSELDLDVHNNTHGGTGASTILSGAAPTALTTKSYLSKTALGAPSIASFNEYATEIYDDDDRVSATSSATRQAPTTVRPGYSELSLESMTQAPSTVFAKERKDKGRLRKDVDEMSEIHEGEYSHDESRMNPVNLFFAEQREREQEKAFLNPSLQDTSFEVRHVTAISDSNFEATHLNHGSDGQTIHALGANPSMRSTPVAAHSAVASVLNGGSNLSFRPNSRPQLGASALPVADDPLPALGHLLDDDDDINTNPSIIQGPIGGRPVEWDMPAAAQSTNDLNIHGDRGLNIDVDDDMLHPGDDSRPVSRLATPHMKDEGYMSAANHIGSPGSVTPALGIRREPQGMGGIDDMLSDPDFYPGHRRNGMGSGNSHGMPSPLYDSATGRGIDRIESKDIVALMEHLTVRDAQRNARDTEILVTLVRSAAEMRNSFEDMKKALEDQRRGIVDDVDQNTERSVQKLIQGPRPLPPSTPRKPRYQKSDEDVAEEARTKRHSVFKRALKGLSMRSSNDLERIEDMLCKLLDEVEGLKDGQQFYQQSFVQSQSMGTIDQLRSPPEGQEAGPNLSFAAGNSGYHSAGPSRQPSGKMYQEQAHQSTHISPIQEDAILDTPPREARGESLPLDTPPHAKIPNASASVGNTPTKSEKHTKRESGSSSIFPKLSRWSETTASSGLKNLLPKSKNNHDGSEASRSQSDFNFWETEGAKGNHADQFNASPFASESQRTERAPSPLLPPSSRGTDAPINQSNRISLDIQHPQPRMTYNHRLEAQAQQLVAEGGMVPNSPQNASVSSLGIYPPIGPGGFQNGKLLSPLAQDAYAQHQAQTSPNAPQLAPKIREQASQDSEMLLNGSSTPKKEKKHRERDENGEKIRKPKKERTEEEKQRRKERKERKERDRESGGSTTSRKKSRDVMSPDGTEGASMSGRTPSTASRLNGPRPLSSASNKENSRRSHRHNVSQSTNDTFGNGGVNGGWGASYR